MPDEIEEPQPDQFIPTITEGLPPEPATELGDSDQQPMASPEIVPVAPVEEGPPFYATEYMFRADSGNIKCVYTLVGAPKPDAPEKFPYLNGTVARVPFQTLADRAIAIG